MGWAGIKDSNIYLVGVIAPLTTGRGGARSCNLELLGQLYGQLKAQAVRAALRPTIAAEQ